MSTQSTRQTELRALARKRIERHELPRQEPSHIWGGRGSGQPCSLCHSPILPSECEYELEQCEAGIVRVYRLHVACETVWQLECAEPSISYF